MRYLWMLPLAFTFGIGCFGGDDKAEEKKPETTQENVKPTARAMKTDIGYCNITRKG